MRRWILVVLGLATLAPCVFENEAAAKPKYGRAGCGLGSIIISPSGPQSSAAISNGASDNQLFGISSGTSNCVATGRNYHTAQQEEFVLTNLTLLAKEMVRGEGETLAAFTTVLGCTHDAYPRVAGQLRASYHRIFAAPGALAILDASKDSLLDAPDLAGNCLYLN